MIGIDEVGRGAWAGPLLSVAVRADDNFIIDGLTDSKLMSKKKREVVETLILERIQDFGLGWVSPGEIDQLGLTAAVRLSMERALNSINPESSEEIIVDGNINYLGHKQSSRAVVKADLLYPVVSAASVLAKLRRDSRMTELDTTYPGYGFSTNVGYGTKEHQAGLSRFGVTDIHRLSYKPVRLHSKLGI